MLLLLETFFLFVPCFGIYDVHSPHPPLSLPRLIVFLHTTGDIAAPAVLKHMCCLRFPNCSADVK